MKFVWTPLLVFKIELARLLAAQVLQEMRPKKLAGSPSYAAMKNLESAVCTLEMLQIEGQQAIPQPKRKKV